MTSLQRRATLVSSKKNKQSGYLVIWEFQVRSGMKKRFEKMYGPEGEWARCFKQNASYIGTDLIHHLKARKLKGNRGYLTLDFWTSRKAYDKFRKAHRAEYKALDQRCEKMTESEREVGRFVRVSKK